VPALLGFAAAPGLVACALLFDKYSTLRGWFMGVFTLDRDFETLPDKYIFLTLGFVISGLATVFKWDSLFPDRKDYMIMAPLPISPVAIFASKFAALVLFVVLFATAVNIAGTIFFPAGCTRQHGHGGGNAPLPDCAPAGDHGRVSRRIAAGDRHGRTATERATAAAMRRPLAGCSSDSSYSF
jgi:hypothetical protein